MMTRLNQVTGCRETDLTSRRNLRRLVFLILAAAFVSGTGAWGSQAQRDDESADSPPSTATVDSTGGEDKPAPAEFLFMPSEDRSRLTKYRVSQVLSGNRVTIEVAGRFVLMQLLGVEAARRETRDFLKGLLTDEEVCLEYDSDSSLHTDSQGHPTAYLYRAGDGLWINHALIAQGYSGLAHVLGPRAELLKDAYRLARINNQGLWSHGKLNLTSTPSLEYIESIDRSRWYRARVRQAWRDNNEGIADAYYEGRRQAATQAGIESALRARASTGQLGGYGKITIKNGANSQVKVNVAAETFSKELVVGANTARSFALPFGQYESSYQIEGDPGGPYKSGSFTMLYEPVEMEIKPKTDKDSGLAKK